MARDVVCRGGWTALHIAAGCGHLGAFVQKWSDFDSLCKKIERKHVSEKFCKEWWRHCSQRKCYPQWLCVTLKMTDMTDDDEAETCVLDSDGRTAIDWAVSWPNRASGLKHTKIPIVCMSCTSSCWSFSVSKNICFRNDGNNTW